MLPSDLAGLKLWSLADGTLWQDSARTTPASADTDPIGACDDESASGAHFTQPTAGNRPLLQTNEIEGLPVIQPDGVNDLLTSPSLSHGIGTGDFYLACVIRTPPTDGELTGYAAIWSNSTFDPCLYINTFSTPTNHKLDLYWGGDRRFDTVLLPGTVYMIEIMRTGTTVKAWINGIEEATTFTISSNMANAAQTIFADGPGGGSYSKIDLAELVLVQGAVSGAEQDGIQDYLGRWFPSNNFVGTGALVLEAFTCAGSGIASAPGSRKGYTLQQFVEQTQYSWTEAVTVILQPGSPDKLLVVGVCDYEGEYTGGEDNFDGVGFDWVVSRLNLDGTPDTDFGTYGTWRIHHDANNNELGEIKITADGKIVLFGISYDSLTASMSVKLMRLLPDGSQDLQFGYYGISSHFPEANRYQCAHLGQQSTGKLITLTNSVVSFGNASIRFARHHQNGALDTSFGTPVGTTWSGILLLKPGGNDALASNYYGRLIVQDDDKLLAAGTYDASGDFTNYNGVVIRVNAEGHETDTGFGTLISGTIYGAVVDFGFDIGNFNSIILTDSGGVLASGNCRLSTTPTQGICIALFDSAGVLDGSFSTDGRIEVNLGSLGHSYAFQPLVLPSGVFRFAGMTTDIDHDTADTVTPTSHNLIVGYTAVGALDGSWGSGGVYEDNSNGMALIFGVLLLDDGNIVTSGHRAYSGSPGIAQAAVSRFTPSGALDLTFGDAVSPPAAPTAPVCVTGAASALAATTATVAGTVNPQGTATTYHFEYGLTTNYLQKSAEANAGSGSSAVAASADLTGLIPGKLYHYRLVAYNGSIGLGADGTFTTAPGVFTVLSDSFTASDGTTLRAHTGHAETDYTGAAYREIEGTGSIQGNKVRFDSAVQGVGNKRWLVQHDTGISDLTASGTVTWNGNNDGNNRPTGIYLRGHSLAEGDQTNADDLVMAGWRVDISEFQIWKLVAGNSVVIDSIPFVVPNGTGRLIRVTANGNRITASIEGGSRTLSGTIDAPTILTNTFAGWYFNRGIGDTIEDFNVETVPAFNGTGALILEALSSAGAGAILARFTGTGALTLQALTSSGSGTFDVITPAPLIEATLDFTHTREAILDM